MRCGTCSSYACQFGGKRPDGCPMGEEELQEVYVQALDKYREPQVNNIAVNSAKIEAEGYLQWCRVEETIEFAHACGFTTVGVAFCIGLRLEAKELVKVLEKNGLEVYSVVCKTGSIDKEEIGISPQDKLRDEGHEPMCNPINQAEILNRAGTELNIAFGLCVGHDSLFIMHSNAPVTCLAVKDRVLAHNPMGALYAKHYFKKKLQDHQKELK